MCLGAMMHARIERIVYGAHDPKTGVCGSTESLIDAKFFNHKINLTSGVLENECKKQLKKFFISRRKINKLKTTTSSLE
jgi:tRNA(adenine34) deaminase